ncbi:MAG TPA: LacI family DNA-binding transcriptional regulator [Anaerolineae bacterium]|nr:LacI family DNA-binding transcriptional regulator [Anaerolineae bacterium]HOR00413.1 LacI family DNA-binding transcriptional regulator [Anaerolineae bacterium]HPL30059.1 LacI family DNA-binding transcriptional regulator [Anaerolineae bacterium]
MVAIKDVAKRAGVSTATVSYVLNNRESISQATRERVLQAARELGYRPSVIAQGLQAGQSRMLGYSWKPSLPDQYNPILDRFLQSMAEAATRHGYHILALPAPSISNEVEVYRELVRTNRVDGLILSATNRNDPRIRYLLDERFPFVAFGRSNPEWDFAWVDVDGSAGLRLAVEHLLALGHRRIACLAWPASSLTGQHRLEGYMQAMAAAGLAVDSSWMVRVVENDYEGAYQATRQMLAMGEGRRPSAIACVSDLIAAGALNAATDMGLEVGRDVAVAGFDDAPIAHYIRPPLTSIRQPLAEVAERAVQMLLALVHGELPAERQVLLEPQLIVRASTQPG